MRTVVIMETQEFDDPPVEIGRAWVDDVGHAHVTGFSASLRNHYLTDGIALPTGEPVMLADGDKFVDQLKLQHSTIYRHAREIDDHPNRNFES